MRARWERVTWGAAALLLGAGACGGGGSQTGDATAGVRVDAGSDVTGDRGSDVRTVDAPAAADGSAPPDGPAAPDAAGAIDATGAIDAASVDVAAVPPLKAKLDIVFAIDNSGSMMEEQANLARNFPQFMRALGATGGAEPPDLHIAVVSSDLGAGAGTYVRSCIAGGDQGVFCQTQSADVCARCGVDTSQGRFLRTRNPNHAGSIEGAFSCMARLGAAGCGFEHQLGALTSALTAAQNGPFLRADAYLALVIISDEDDCTAPGDSALFASMNPEQDISLRCSLEGHVCNGAHNTGMADVDLSLGQCQTATDGALRPVGALVNDVLAVKADPARIIAAGIFGWPLPGNESVSRYQIASSGGLATRAQRPVCQSTNGSAVVAFRIKSFVESFPSYATISICQSDFRPALEQIAARIRATTGG